MSYNELLQLLRAIISAYRANQGGPDLRLSLRRAIDQAAEAIE